MNPAFFSVPLDRLLALEQTPQRAGQTIQAAAALRDLAIRCQMIHRLR